MKKILITLLFASMLLTSCGGDTIKIGDYTVPKGALTYYEKSFASQYSDADVKTMAEEQIKLNYAYNEVGKKLNLNIDENQISERKKIVIEGYGGQSEYNSFLKQEGLTDKFIEEIIMSTLYKEAIKEYALQNEPITKEYYDTYFKENYRRAKHVLIQCDETNKEEKRALAEDILKRAKNGEDFDTLIKEYSEDPGTESNPDGYVFTDNQMVKSFQDGVDNIQIGEYNLVESDYGYHVIKRLALDETPELYEKFYNENKKAIEDNADNDYIKYYTLKKADELGINI